MTIFNKCIFIIIASTYSLYLGAQSVATQIDNMDIDYQIRATEDPSFDQFLAKEIRYKKLEKNAARFYKEKRAAEKEKQKKVRNRFAKINETTQRKRERAYLQAKRVYEKRQKSIQKRNAKLAKKYANEQVQKRKKEKQHQKKLIAKMQLRLSRMPASQLEVQKRKRIPPEKRLELYKKVLEINRQKRSRK